METYKAKDLYVVRPLKLVRSREYIKAAFPYNLLMKLGLIPKAEIGVFIEKNIIKRKIARKLPKHFYQSIMFGKKSKYYFSADDIAIAILDSMNDQYYNVLTGERYDAPGFMPPHIKCFEPTELVVNSKILKKTNLAHYIYLAELLKSQEDNKNNLGIEIQEPRLEEARGKEITLEELYEIRGDLASKESDRLLTVDSMSSQGFVEGPFYTSVISFDSKGKKIKPVNKFKVKEKKIRRS